LTSSARSSSSLPSLHLPSWLQDEINDDPIPSVSLVVACRDNESQQLNAVTNAHSTRY
jgi:hypothetical protein